MKYLKKCKHCHNEFETHKIDKEFCSSNHKAIYKRKQIKKPKIEHTCENCEKTFYSYTKNIRYCSRKCSADLNNRKIRERKRIENEEKYKNVQDIPTCKICGWKSRSLQSHLVSHDLTVQQYKEQFGSSNSDIFHSSYIAKLSERIKGENNPGYQHGGKLSSFSKKFIKYDNLSESDKKEKIDKQVERESKTKQENDSYTTTVEYYIKRGYATEEAKVLLRKRQQTFSLAICIEKHGEVEGTKIWEERQRKWLGTLDSLPTEEKQRIHKLKADGAKNNRTCSKISKMLFESVAQPGAYFGSDEKALRIDGKYIRPDFLIGNKIIEFYGDYWHANPERYEEHTTLNYPQQSLTCKEVWNRDEKRIASLEKNGYSILIIWENDYKKDQQGTVEKCLDFLRKE